VDIKSVRKLLSDHVIDLEFSVPHAVVEAKEDGLTVADLERAVMAAELVEDYGERALFLPGG